MDLPYDFQVAPVPQGERGGGPFAHAVHREHRGAREGRRKESAGGMTQMMLGKQQAPLPIDLVIELRELIRQQAPLEQFLLDPQRQRLPERCEPPRGKREIGLEQTLELQEWLVVERHELQIAGTGRGRFQAPSDGPVRKPRIVLLPREALLLRGGNYLPVFYQRRGAVVVIGRYAEDAHRHIRTACR